MSVSDQTIQQSADEIRRALAYIVSGPPDNGVSHRRALDALGELVAECESWRRIAKEYEAALADRGLL